MTSCTENFGSMPIDEKIRMAHELFAKWGFGLRQDPRIGSLVLKLRQKIAASQKAMFDVGVAIACRTCEEEEGGSCCGKGIEDKYNPTLLLMNLLLEQPLPAKRHTENSCYFLGEQGCSLAARHVICVNYLCGKIQHTIPLRDIIDLQTTNGEELDAVFILHEAIKKFIGS